MDLRLDSFTVSIKALRTVLPFLSYKGSAQAYLVKISVTHNKYLKFLFLEDTYPILAKSATQILSLNFA